MSGLRIQNLSKVFTAAGSRLTALDQLTLEAHPGELLVVLGPSGCGKTTLLRLIAGLEQPTSGEIELHGERITTKKPQDRSIGMAFQYPALLPQLTVAENISLGPKLRGASAAERSNRTRDLADLLNITDLLPRRPETLSGGQQQRVSLARALATRPNLLLLDEPLANLDPTSRHELRTSIRTVQQKLRITTLYVTHDQGEATAVADRIAIINSGNLQQIATAPELYTHPVNLFVAEFFAPEPPNLIPGKIESNTFHATGSPLTLRAATDYTGPATCLIRPRSIKLEGPLTAQITSLQHTGWSTTLLLSVQNIQLRALLSPSSTLRISSSVSINISSGELIFFSSSGALLT